MRTSTAISYLLEETPSGADAEALSIALSWSSEEGYSDNFFVAADDSRAASSTVTESFFCTFSLGL